MLAETLSAVRSNDPAVITSDGSVTWSELAGQIELLTARVAPFTGQRIGLRVPASASGIAAMAALDQTKSHTYLIDENATDDQIVALCERFRLPAIVSCVNKEWKVSDVRSVAAGAADSSSESTVTILTSGTEGVPKAATYTWPQLARPVRIANKPTGDVWLLTYRIHLYAGMQVVLQAMLNQQTCVIPSPAAEPAAIVGLMAQSGVTSASATPSFWRRLLLFGDRDVFSRVPLRQITLGGELSDQPLLDSLRSEFPPARLTHIYATTELGRCFAVTDGLAGFPVSYLETDDQRRPSHVDALLKVEDGQLFVKPKNGSHAVESASPAVRHANAGSEADADSGWTATGDLVECTPDRIFFAGRAGDMINVGGNKVRPAMVEATIRTVAGVADVRVFGQSSSIAGQLVACELVAAEGVDPGELKTKVQQTCRQALQPYECPRLVQLVAEIAVSDAGKTKR
jgi:acyl-CoA synthetase (AMP-forming)/AMP-acid ligase II